MNFNDGKNNENQILITMSDYMYEQTSSLVVYPLIHYA